MSITPPVRRFRVTFIIRCHSYWSFMHVIIWLGRFLCDKELSTAQVEEVEPE